MHRTTCASTSASTVPRAAIERAYRDLIAIRQAGLYNQFLDDYYSLVTSRDWQYHNPIEQVSCDLVASDLARLLGEERERVASVARSLFVSDRIAAILDLLSEFARKAREAEHANA